MALRPIDGERRNAAIRSETDAGRTERQAIRALRADLLTIINGWDAATNAQRFVWMKDVTQALRRALTFV